jgi:hypothetical protein
MKGTNVDPYCYTTGLPMSVTGYNTVLFIVQYQCDQEVNDGQIFYCRPNAAGGICTDTDLHFYYTGIDPNNESLWREFRFDLSDAITRFSWGASGHRLRFDYANGAGVRILVRNVEIWYR